MDYKYNEYDIKTKKEIPQTRIVTLSDLNWNKDTTKSEMDDIIIRINDIVPKYIFLLGNITDYNTLKNYLFQKKLSYFFDLLSCISEPYLVFGEKDYRYNDSYISIDKLIDIYKQFNVSIVNDYLEEHDSNIIGLNLEPEIHYSPEQKKIKIGELIKRIDSIINKDKFTILMTHSDLSVLKHEKELLNYFDLILTKTNSTMESPSLLDRFKSKEDKVINDFLIENGGIHQTEEMDYIKIKRYKK